MCFQVLREFPRASARQRGVAAQLGRPGQCARVEAGRQVHVVLQPQHRLQRAVLESQVCLGAKAQALQHRAVDQPLQVGRAAHAQAFDLRRAGAGLEQRQRGQAQRLERHLVAQRHAGDAQLGLRLQSRREARDQRAPLRAVEARQHRAAKVERLGRR